MRYFAKLGINNKVMGVHTVHENELKDSAGVEQESLGIEFLTNIHKYPNWVQCWKDRSKRKHFPGPGMTYDDDRDAFIPKKIFSSWTLNESTCDWEAPIAQPNDGKFYAWNDGTQGWDEVID